MSNSPIRQARCVSPAGQSRASRAGVDTCKSGEVGGGVVEFCDTNCSECGETCLRGDDNPTNEGLALHIALHSHRGNDGLSKLLPRIPHCPICDKGAASVSSLGSDDEKNHTTQPQICRYPKWESFCKHKGYSIVPLIGTTNRVTSSPLWAARLHDAGLINFGESLAWKGELPTTLFYDDYNTPPLLCNGPVAFVGSKDPDLGFVWVMEEIGAGGSGRLVFVDETGTDLLVDKEEEERFLWPR